LLLRVDKRKRVKWNLNFLSFQINWRYKKINRGKKENKIGKISIQKLVYIKWGFKRKKSGCRYYLNANK